jgi:putative transposase
MVKGFAYGYSHDGTYGQLADDGLTQWHPAFLQLGDTLEACAARYRAFCQRDVTSKKPGGRRRHWGLQWRPEVSGRRGMDPASAQLRLWDTRCQVGPGDRPRRRSSTWLIASGGPRPWGRQTCSTSRPAPLALAPHHRSALPVIPVLLSP